MKLSLEDRVALITGPAKGMGASITHAFAAEGCKLALMGRDTAAIERARLDATLADEMTHPEIAKIGIGDISDERMAKAIDILVKAKELPRTPAVAEIFDRSFLPTASERPTAIRPAM